MILRPALFLIPVFLLAQTPPADTPKPAEPPAEVDQALRARVKEFLQYNVEGNFRKAYDMVAEDSKDFYFGMNKAKSLNFELTSIDYSNNFTKAVVKGSSKRIVAFSGREVEMPLPFYDTWEIHDGKWMWTHAESKMVHTPMGDIPVDPEAKPSSGGGLPKDLSEEAARAAGKQLQAHTAINKESMSFTSGKAGSDELIFHNGVNGFVRVLATPIFDGGAFRAEPSEASVPAGKDITFVVHYDPSAGTPLRAPTLRLTIEPFEQVYYVALKLAEDAK